MNEPWLPVLIIALALLWVLLGRWDDFDRLGK